MGQLSVIYCCVSSSKLSSSTDEVSADGICNIEAILFESNYAIASLQDVSEGASSLIFECVDNRTPGEGGLAKEFGTFVFLCQLNCMLTSQAATTSLGSSWLNHRNRQQMCAVTEMLQ